MKVGKFAEINLQKPEQVSGFREQHRNRITENKNGTDAETVQKWRGVPLQKRLQKHFAEMALMQITLQK